MWAKPLAAAGGRAPSSCTPACATMCCILMPDFVPSVLGVSASQDRFEKNKPPAPFSAPPSGLLKCCLFLVLEGKAAPQAAQSGRGCI